MVSTAPMAKLGAMSTPVSGDASSQPLQLREALVGPAGGADDGVDAVADAEVEVVHHRGRGGEVDRDLGAGLGQRLQLVAPAERGDQLHVLGGLDGP